eukprot:363211-Chlamydomonas_euryale.AAC.11
MHIPSLRRQQHTRCACGAPGAHVEWYAGGGRPPNDQFHRLFVCGPASRTPTNKEAVDFVCGPASRTPTNTDAVAARCVA